MSRFIANFWARLLAVASLLYRDERGELVFDLADPGELVGFVRQVQRDVDAAQLILSQVLPNVFQDGITFQYSFGQVLTQNAAKYRSWDTPAPIGKRQGLERRSGELAPISEKIPVTEELAHRLRQLNAGNAQSLVDQIFDDASNEARAVARRIELARGEVLETAKLDLNENGVIQVVDFGRDADLTPAVQGGNLAVPTTLWSNTSASDPIKDIQDDIDLYASFNNGRRPGAILTSSAIISFLLRNDSIRTILASTVGTPQIITQEAFANVLRSFNLPPMVAYDVDIEIDGTPTEVISDDVVIYVPDAGAKCGETVFGPTMEALKLVEAKRISIEDAPGLVAVVENTSDPVQTWTKAAGVALPILTNPNATLVRKVI